MMEGDNNVTNNRKGKQKTSIVWAHFTRSKEDTVICDHCQKTLLQCQGSTSSLLKHLRTKHPTVMPNVSSNGQQSEGLLTDLAEERKRSGRKEKQSIVWAHFTRGEEDGDVTCLHCKKRLKYSTGSTTSMRKHLRARHPAEMHSSERHRALESRGGDMATDQSLDDHSESNQLCQQRVETLLNCLEEKERELAEAYETFQNTVRALREDMETIKELLTNLTGEHHEGRRGNTVSNRSRHTGPNSFQDEDCGDKPLLSLSCTSEPISPGYEDAERSQRSSADQEVTIIGLFTPHSTVYSSYDKIVDYTNTYMQATYTSETNPSNSPGSAGDTETRPQQLILRTPSVRLLDCKHKLGPDGLFLVHSDETQKKEEEGGGDEDEYVDCSNDNEVIGYNLEMDPDYNPAENYECDSNSEKFFQTSDQTKPTHQASSLHEKQQHPASPPQEALPKETPGGNPMEERPFKCPKCSHSYKFCSDFIQHLKMHGVGLKPLRPNSRQEIEDDGDGDGGDKTELDPEDIPENADNIEDKPEKQALQSPSKTISSSNVTKDEAKQCVSEPLKSSKPVKPHPCKICGRRLSTSAARSVHQRRHREENVPSAQDTRGRKVYQCGECDRSFVGLYFYHIHQGTHRGERPYVCPWCRKTFVYPASFHRHKKWHCKERPSHQTSARSAKGHAFACAQCPMTFYQRASLKCHERRHSDERPYKCPLCTKTFKYPGSLRGHLKAHDGQKPYLCDHCGKSFRQLSQLKRHLLFHSEEKLYKCSVCDKRYHIQQSLTQHILTHSEERPFKCRICDKGFTRLYLVQKHERVHTKEKPYCCSVCGKVFGYQESLYVHQKRCHSALGKH